MTKLGKREWGIFALMVIIVILLFVAPKANGQTVINFDGRTAFVSNVVDESTGLSASRTLRTHNIGKPMPVVDEYEIVLMDDGEKIFHEFYEPIGSYPVKQVNGKVLVKLANYNLPTSIWVEFKKGEFVFPDGYSIEDYFNVHVIRITNIKLYGNE